MGRMLQFQINGCCNIGNDGSHVAITVLSLCRCANNVLNGLCVFCLVTGLCAKAVEKYENMPRVGTVLLICSVTKRTDGMKLS